MANLADALKLHELGWRVVAAPTAGKAPLGSWKHAQTEPATQEELEEAFSQPRSIFIITGAISELCVLDCDDQQAVAWWRERLGDVLDETTCASSGKGFHFYFRLPKGTVRKGRSSPGGDSGKWDLRAEGGGVIAPPSVHANGKVYRWVRGRGPSALKEAPAGLWPDAADKDEKGPRSAETRAWLLANPPEEGGRNVWLSKYAGHEAIREKFFDAFQLDIRQRGEALGLDYDEVEKLIVSIWAAEQSKEGKALPAPPVEGEGGDWRVTDPELESGFLVSGDTRILVQVRERDEEGSWTVGLAPWLNADFRAIGIFEMPDDSRIFHLECRTRKGVREVDLSSKVLGNATRLNEWLTGLGLSLYNPPQVFPPGMSHTARLTAYLESQDPPTQKAAPALGWDEEAGAFLTHEGLIREDGYHPFEAVRPGPGTKEWAPYEYGFETGAVDVLREVLSFHHYEVTAVFGAWWAACFLKPQIAAVFSQFPIMAIEAPSESGKSTGFFPIMLELSGNTQGKSQVTKAALRDYLSAHRNGIVWVDDMNDLKELGELIRNTSVEGSVVKKALDQRSQMSTRMLAALCISGESLGLRGEKAMADRSIHLSVPSPVGRKSPKGDYPQYDDIVALQKRVSFPDYAGTIVADALRLAPEVEGWAKNLRSEYSGRFADKVAIVKLGARVLERLIRKEDGELEHIVTLWADREMSYYNADDNTLTTTILPQILRRIGIKGKPEGPDSARKQVATPMFVCDGTVWFSPQLVADYWSDQKWGKVEARVESAEAIEQQAKACGAGGKKGTGRKYFDYATGGGGQNYWRLPDDLGETVKQRSEGEDHGKDQSS